jgi:hypothetical protein
VYLTKSDRFPESGGHKFVRYADDRDIYVRSRRAGIRVMSGCKRYLEGVLKLKINEEKSAVGSPLRLKFPGFSLYKGHNGTRIRIHAKFLKRSKSKLKHITRRSRGVSVSTVLNNLKSCVRGRLGYYAIADMSKAMKMMTDWVRRRIRMYVWKQWKRVRTRFTGLKELGTSEDQAW